MVHEWNPYKTRIDKEKIFIPEGRSNFRFPEGFKDFLHKYYTFLDVHNNSEFYANPQKLT